MHHQWGFAESLARIPDSGVEDILRLPGRDRSAIENLAQAAAARATGILQYRRADRPFHGREIDMRVEEPVQERRRKHAMSTGGSVLQSHQPAIDAHRTSWPSIQSLERRR